MSTVLYVKASPRHGRSHSVAVADAFINAYRQAHPDDTIRTLDLFSADLPAFDGHTINAKYKIMHGQAHSADEKLAWEKVVAAADNFKAADKYVIAAPMWNFGIPYKLKHYIDVLVQPTLTFTVGEDGSYSGLVTGRPALVVYARGGEYPDGTPAEAFDFQKKYVELALGFIGFTDIRSIVVEPTLAQGPDVAEERRTGAIEQARQLATEF